MPATNGLPLVPKNGWRPFHSPIPVWRSFIVLKGCNHHLGARGTAAARELAIESLAFRQGHPSLFLSSS